MGIKKKQAEDLKQEHHKYGRQTEETQHTRLMKGNLILAHLKTKRHCDRSISLAKLAGTYGDAILISPLLPECLGFKS